jgi:predicted RNA-binding protein
MCEASAYLIDGQEPQLIMESVDMVTPEADGLNLVNIFGEQKFVKARIHSLELVEHKIFLENIA